jgi:arginine decarboxylase
MEQDEYCLECWSQDNFIVDDGVVKINYGSKPSLLEIVESAKKIICKLQF